MKKLITLLLLFCSLPVFTQNGITFEVEELSKPKNLLPLKASGDIYKSLIRSDVQISDQDIIRKNKIEINYDIITQSAAPDSLVSYGYHPFFYGMYEAYANHRPFVLSPDMIWLLISQGFSRHINANPEELRKHFVDFSDQLSLLVVTGNDLITNPQGWEEIFPQLTRKIAEHTGEELINILTADFSTTTSVEKIASEITIMEAMKPFFEYVVTYLSCGIPEITLQGTPEDWKKVLEKTRVLEKYDLKWWIKEIMPLLQHFVDASEGKVSKHFWRNMFKYHSSKKYGAPNIIDGWIVKFFPYDKDGKRNNLEELVNRNSLPDEIVKVDLKYLEINNGHTNEIMLELWSGFIGLEQNPETFALTPKIGWMIKKKDVNEFSVTQKLQFENIPLSTESGINIKILEVPKVLKNLNEIYSLSLHFKNEVFIPDWMKEIRIGKLSITGKITEEETAKIIDWFPNTYLRINNNTQNKGKNGWIVVSGNVIPNEVLRLKNIWVLEIQNRETTENKLKIPKKLKNIDIQNLSLSNKTSPENIEKIKKLLPETTIYMQGKKIQ